MKSSTLLLKRKVSLKQAENSSIIKPFLLFTMPLLDLPDELPLQIFENLESERDILSILLTSHRIYAIQQTSPLYKHNIRSLGSSALRWYSAKGCKSAVEAPRETGADLECRSKDGVTSLVSAATHGHESVVQLLLEKGSDIEARTTYFWARRTPLR